MNTSENQRGPYETRFRQIIEQMVFGCTVSNALNIKRPQTRERSLIWQAEQKQDTSVDPNQKIAWSLPQAWPDRQRQFFFCADAGV
jgi:hypothetical protein